ncbi:MAG: transporter [Phycisphaeraceae bacterium]
MARNPTRAIIVGPLLALTLGTGGYQVAYAAGLNTDVALTPPEGGTLIRVQWRYTELSNDPTPMGRTVKLSIQPITVVYGLTQNFVILGTVPIVHKRVELGSGAQIDNTGIGDIPLLVKYRFYQDDKPGQTTRWAVIGGVEVPTYDEPFSSESLDPIIGTVWTYQRRDWWVDWDVLYKFNTAGGIDGDDELRGDVALSYRLLGGQSDEIGPWGLYAISEINANYLTDGSSQVFGSPGLQIITPNAIIEAGVQLPIHQSLKSPRLETDLTVVLSVRLQF